MESRGAAFATPRKDTRQAESKIRKRAAPRPSLLDRLARRTDNRVLSGQAPLLLDSISRRRAMSRQCQGTITKVSAWFSLNFLLRDTIGRKFKLTHYLKKM